MNHMRTSGCFVLLLLGLVSCKGQESPNETPEEIIKRTTPYDILSPVSSKSQIIGTHAISNRYKFTADPQVIEEAKRILEMGSNMIKIKVLKDTPLNTILAMPFDTFFFWWRSTAEKWENGLSEADKQTEYKATYEFAKKLLTDNAKLKRTFYLGHWEGDWYLVPNYDKPNFNPNANAVKTRIPGMIEWLNIRQKAVDDARNAVPNTLSEIYHYAEVNRVRDAMDKGLDRVVNKVLPYTNVDYVSYSSYDVQNSNLKVINETLKYIEDKLPKKAGIIGPRIFIGECGVPAKEVGFDPKKHEEANRKIFIKFLKSDVQVPYILYWTMYNNEVEKETGKHKGFWLIDNKNQKWSLYYMLEALYKAQTGFTNIRQQTLEWLEQRK